MRFKQVDVGHESTCAVTVEGELRCWGRDLNHELDGPNADMRTDNQSIAVGSHSCALRADGSVECWRHPYYSAQPTTDVYEATDFTQISTWAAKGRIDPLLGRGWTQRGK
jgi:hypothetical protein